MNLGVFNRVNYNTKELENSGMYSEWASLTNLIQTGNEESQSVLGRFPMAVGKEVAMAVVKQLALNLGINLSQPAEPSSMQTDREVQWCMEVICFGLSLPLSEHDTIRDCVNVYCEWLSALHPMPKISVPKPVCEDPNLYARKMINHFHNLFVPRKGEGADIINRQAVLCHRVLRTLQLLVQLSTTLTRETWEALLLFLLAINDTLLAPPTVKDDVGDQLCERVLSVLVEVWLMACARCFPSPPLWKTLRETCMNWRHRLALVEQWNRVNLALTSRLLTFMYGSNFPTLKISEEDANLIPAEMTNDCVAQSWFRFLHCLGNPVHLSKPSIVSQSQKFLHFTIINGNVVDPSQHPCLQALPLIFSKAIKGISGQVDAFLGIAQSSSWDDAMCPSEKEKKEPLATHSPTPPPQRRLAKSFSVAPSAVTRGIPKASLIGLTSSRNTTGPTTTPNSGPPSNSSLNSLGPEVKNVPAEGRPKCNSLLHLFGEWLLEGAYVGCPETSTTNIAQMEPRRPGSLHGESSAASSPGSSLSIGAETTVPTSVGLNKIMDDRYETGRAEAIGALARIFCSKKTGEEILPVYLARFYLVMQHGLKVYENGECSETLASILINSTDLFRLDLDGVQVLLPYFVEALELVLPDKELKIKSQNVSKTELRRSAIQILLSMLVLPLHFQNLNIKSLQPERGILTFAQLKPRLMNLLIYALQVESDSLNSQMLLGGLLLSVQDSACAEEVDQITQDVGSCSDNTSNLLSSACDTFSTSSVRSEIETPSGYEDETDSLGSGNMYLDPIGYGTNSAHALFVRATYLVCHRLISSWKTDLNVSLAALELLAGLARIHIRETDALECKRAVKWLCDYIQYQCWRPPPAHSKDLHSSIVAAFQVAAVWLCAHPYLLQDKDCLTTVLEVVELGISGSKSQGKPGEPIKMKDEKELKPASMRVRDAAEALLTNILEQVGYFPSPCGAESISSRLDEKTLLRHCSSFNPKKRPQDHFKYLVVENSTLLALLEEPLGNDQGPPSSIKNPQPTVTVLIRGPFGRHAWTMQLRHLPRHKSGTKYHAHNPGRPVAMCQGPGVHHDVKQRYFPETIERIPQCKVDQSIPSLESLILEQGLLSEHNLLSQLIENQAVMEAEHRSFQETASPQRPEFECQPPKACDEFQTARLFLSHFGFLASNGNISTKISALDTFKPELSAELETLDCMGSRTCDTVHIFYVRAGQRNADEILANVRSESKVHPHFLEMLLSLGYPVNVYSHPGWTGHTSTSWKITQPVSQTPAAPPTTGHGGAAYNGDNHVLYWADACSEIAFVIPTYRNDYDNISSIKSTCIDNLQAKPGGFERSISEANPGGGRLGIDKPRALSLDLDKNPSPTEPGRRRHGPARQHTTAHSNTKILVFWTESFEDHLQLPLAELLTTTLTGLESPSVPITAPGECFVLVLHSLRSGLLRVKLQGPPGRVGLATPLVDGMVVSRRALGPLLRQTALNICRRRRLDNDSYQPPHVRRRLKVQELVQKFRLNLTEPELLTYLFS